MVVLFPSIDAMHQRAVSSTCQSLINQYICLPIYLSIDLPTAVSTCSSVALSIHVSTDISIKSISYLNLRYLTSNSTSGGNDTSSGTKPLASPGGMMSTQHCSTPWGALLHERQASKQTKQTNRIKLTNKRKHKKNNQTINTSRKKKKKKNDPENRIVGMHFITHRGLNRLLHELITL